MSLHSPYLISRNSYIFIFLVINKHSFENAERKKDTEAFYRWN